MDDSASSVFFDEHGICNYCRKHDDLMQLFLRDTAGREEALAELVRSIRKAGKRKRYDCIVGLSGGTDSTYTLFTAVQLGLRPLAVFFDNGWSTEIAVSNIKNAVDKLGVDLVTHVVNWEEFKELQIAFLKASVPCLEVPTDVAIVGILYKWARKQGVKFILSGASFMTEGIVPIEWSFLDGAYVRNVNKLFSGQKFKSYPIITLREIFFNTFFRRIKIIPFTNYLDYDKVAARQVLERNLDWKYYGGHHYENLYSHWAFGWYTVKKFGFDKRKVSLSGPVRMGIISREDALLELSSPPPVESDLTTYVLKKLNVSPKEFELIMNAPVKSFRDYKTSYNWIVKFKVFIKWAIRMKLLSPVIYKKYFS